MSTYNLDAARTKAEAIIEAEDHLTRYLGECFPEGAQCKVMLFTGQKVPTPATIVAVSPDRYGGSVTVQIATKKKGSRRRHRRIPASEVSEVVLRPAPENNE